METREWSLVLKSVLLCHHSEEYEGEKARPEEGEQEGWRQRREEEIEVGEKDRQQ